MNDVNSGGGDTGLESNNTGTTTTITGRQLIHEDVDDDYYVPYSLRTDPLWADVTPLPQDDGEFTIARISYAPEFVEVYDYMRAVLKSEEVSERALDLTEKAARLNPANYTVWFYRRKLIRELQADLKKELLLLDDLIEMHPKNYQVWFHRQKIIDMRQNAKGELKFVQSMLDEDPKNYHAWQYRQWLIKTFSLWEGELHYVQKLLEEDVRNNSAWNQRYFVITHTTDYTEGVRAKEVMYTLASIDMDIYNESAWNYLRGITQTLDNVYSYKLGEPYNSAMLERMRALLQHEGAPDKQLSPYLCMYAFTCFEDYLRNKDENLSSDEKEAIIKKELEPILIKLETKDDIVRKNYWKFIRLKLNKEFVLA